MRRRHRPPEQPADGASGGSPARTARTGSRGRRSRRSRQRRTAPRRASATRSRRCTMRAPTRPCRVLGGQVARSRRQTVARSSQAASWAAANTRSPVRWSPTAATTSSAATGTTSRPGSDEAAGSGVSDFFIGGSPRRCGSFKLGSARTAVVCPAKGSRHLSQDRRAASGCRPYIRARDLAPYSPGGLRVARRAVVPVRPGPGLDGRRLQPAAARRRRRGVHPALAVGPPLAPGRGAGRHRRRLRRPLARRSRRAGVVLLAGRGLRAREVRRYPGRPRWSGDCRGRCVVGRPAQASGGIADRRGRCPVG